MLTRRRVLALGCALVAPPVGLFVWFVPWQVTATICAVISLAFGIVLLLAALDGEFDA